MCVCVCDVLSYNPILLKTTSQFTTHHICVCILMALHQQDRRRVCQ